MDFAICLSLVPLPTHLLVFVHFWARGSHIFLFVLALNGIRKGSGECKCKVSFTIAWRWWNFEMSDSWTCPPLPRTSSSSSRAFVIFSGLCNNNVIAHSTVLDVVSISTINKSCNKGVWGLYCLCLWLILFSHILEPRVKFFTYSQIYGFLLRIGCSYYQNYK